ncbi:MAG TPA: fumarylacetoacetase [Mycobacteriales bacterium]|jgi:fumarylacetoacetase|nr:fumarylacetoacetase [Mycobacteriales bacterium]
MSSWVPVPAGSDFTIDNLPYGVWSRPDGERRIGVAIGDRVLDLAAVSAAGLLDDAIPDAARVFGAKSINELMSRGRPAWSAVRRLIRELLTGDDRSVEPMLVPMSDVTMHLAFDVGDYVDFYSSIHHATNVGRMFRPDAEPLLPNWRHLPVGYHGRAGTVVVSGTPVVRPCGQRKPPDADAPTYGPSTRLDIEAEVGFVVGVPTALGTRVAADAVADHVFGVVLVNDWSARDIQAWEYVPLGPFLGKSFATSVSAWVVPLEALTGARVPQPVQEPVPLDYLRSTEDWGLDLAIEVLLNDTVVARPPFASMYWTVAQQLAHLTVNGAALRTGDLFASGTVSGPERDQRGSLLELSWGGAEPFELADGTARSFLADGDTVSIAAVTGTGPHLGFGNVTGRIEPAVD